MNKLKTMVTAAQGSAFVQRIQFGHDAPDDTVLEFTDDDGRRILVKLTPEQVASIAASADAIRRQR